MLKILYEYPKRIFFNYNDFRGSKKKVFVLIACFDELLKHNQYRIIKTNESSLH